ncbi:MAG: glycosyltransferase [Clostridiales bacterium]|nr:glycosyltransferase [Clostridiales bacterium]
MLNIQKLVKPENTETMFQEDKIKVSVVIPCYNVGKYLKKCIESVLAQTLREIEIIAVDDGSTDNTGKLLDDYKEIDSRFTVIHQKNGGYGKAVNHGISKAKGEYIGIVESDDFISEDMYERLYDSSFNGTVDVVKTGFYDYYEVEGEIPTPVRNEERNSMPEMKKPAALKQIPQILEGHPSVWSAIYRREFLGKNHIVFKEAPGGGWVDNPFFFETVCKAKKIFWLNEPLYYYRKTNSDSSSNKQANPVLPFERMEDNLDIIKKRF